MKNVFNMWSPESYNEHDIKFDDKLNISNCDQNDFNFGNFNYQELDNTCVIQNDSRGSSNSCDFIDNSQFDTSNVKLENNHDNSFNENDDTNTTITEKKRQQNRDAQRTFRQRKKLQLKTLETQLQKSKTIQNFLKDKVEQLRKQLLKTQSTNRNLLKRQLEEVSTDNKSTNNAVSENDAIINDNSNCDHIENHDLNLKVAFPTEDDFIQNQVGDSIHTGKRVKLEYAIENGDKLLTVPATWEYLQKENDEIEFDVIKVMQNLKGKEMCHGNGAAYPKNLIDNLIKLNSFN